MAKFIVRRLLQMTGLFFVFLILTWVVLQALPGDTIAQRFRLNPNLPPEAIDLAIARLGLDKPWYIQFRDYLTGFFTGDLGVSFSQYPRPVRDIILERLPRTLVLFATALVVQYYVGFQAGKFLAWRRNQRGEMAVTVGGVALYTVFYPWFALMMIWLFAAQLDWLPIGQFITISLWKDVGFSSNEIFVQIFWTVFVASLVVVAVTYWARRIDKPGNRILVRIIGYAATLIGFFGYWTNSDVSVYARDIAKHMVLPVAILTLIGFAGIMLLTRSSMLETMKEDFILTARAKGLSERDVRDKHAARTALLPVSTSLVIAVATVIDGGIVTESVFSWPGMGQLLLGAVLQEDLPLAVAAFSFTGLLALVGHFVADILYGVLDPRIRVTAQG
ncbi:MAG: ABC transporter permease [Acidimicrobiia bacterium]|nr:ABC transporter permease [Acidimicrobiia bacterium]